MILYQGEVAILLCCRPQASCRRPWAGGVLAPDRQPGAAARAAGHVAQPGGHLRGEPRHRRVQDLQLKCSLFYLYAAWRSSKQQSRT